MSVCRLVFFLINKNYFSSPGLTDFLHGFRFDLVAITWVLLPFYLFMVIPVKQIQSLLHLQFINSFYRIMVCLFILANNIDVIYFKFILKRSTWDVLAFVSTGNDVVSLVPLFLMDYWYMVLIAVVLFYIFLRIDKKIILKESNDENMTQQLVYSVFIVLILILGARGGLQLKPLNIIDASRYSAPQNVPLLINTPFSIIKTLNTGRLELKNYMEPSRAKMLFNPHIQLDGDSSKEFKNVVIIIMESFSKEYVGFFHNGKGYTTFLDSLMGHSLVFENAFANGKKSIEALPAIFSGLPNLMNASYNNSSYAGNNISSLASELKPFGYSSHFFHGGKNGTMGFDSYVHFVGFDFYYGKDQYNNEEDFDGNWGIYDLPFFQYIAKKQLSMKEPFLTGFFSLSAHHPYILPSNFEGNCPDGELPIHPTICYSDQALKKYFEKIKDAPWYQNSVFLITADHTAQNVDPRYGTSKGIYSIPLVIFDPSVAQSKIISKVTQQADITPTILDYLGLPANMIIFGQSALDQTQKGFAINYLNNIYQYIDDDYTILFDGENTISAYENQKDPLFKVNLMDQNESKIELSELKLKAIIQTYNNRMINNTLFIDE